MIGTNATTSPDRELEELVGVQRARGARGLDALRGQDLGDLGERAGEPHLGVVPSDAFPHRDGGCPAQGAVLHRDRRLRPFEQRAQ